MRDDDKAGSNGGRPGVPLGGGHTGKHDGPIGPAAPLASGAATTGGVGAGVVGRDLKPSLVDATLEKAQARLDPVSFVPQRDEVSALQVPTLAAPSGGGAMRSIGERFAARTFSGTGGTSIPIDVPNPRGLAPQMALAYDSGGGNGPFGLGWSVGFPAISRKTDRGLPRYLDIDLPGADTDPDRRADTFMFSGGEDLVPVLADPADPTSAPWVSTVGDHEVRRFRPRVEEAFARIERWRHNTTREVHWRVWSNANVLSILGEGSDWRISDPADEGRVFTWLLQEQRDEFGNVVRYHYKREDTEDVDLDAPEERERLAAQPAQAQRYLVRVEYANATPFVASDFAFEVRLDYGQLTEHGAEGPTWTSRPDVFSTFRSGFDIRTRRLCRRVLVLHRFAALDEDPVLVRALELAYDEDPVGSRLTGVAVRGYRYDAGTETYTDEVMPAVEYVYSDAQVGTQVRWVDEEALHGTVGAIDGGGVRFVDLDGEGIPGLLLERGGHYWYKAPLGEARYGALRVLPSLPAGARSLSGLLDLDGSGVRSLVDLEGASPGYWSRNAREGSLALAAPAPTTEWEAHRTFKTVVRGVTAEAPQVSGRQVTFLDLDGDGFADLVSLEGNRISWWPSRGRDGYGPHGYDLTTSTDERRGPTWMHSPEKFDARRVKVGDSDGTGTTDLLYVDGSRTRLWRNQAGNGFAQAVEIPLPALDGQSTTDFVDLLGTGTGCIVWTTSLASARGRRHRYVELTPAYL